MSNHSELEKDIAEFDLKRLSRVIPIEDVEEGMVVARDVLNSSGKCLITEGTVLTSFLTKSLIHQGITHISVKSTEKETETFSEEEILVAREEGEKRLKERFGKVPSDLMMRILYDTALKIEMLDYLRCRKR